MASTNITRSLTLHKSHPLGSSRGSVDMQNAADQRKKSSGGCSGHPLFIKRRTSGVASGREKTVKAPRKTFASETGVVRLLTKDAAQVSRKTLISSHETPPKEAAQDLLRIADKHDLQQYPPLHSTLPSEGAALSSISCTHQGPGQYPAVAESFDLRRSQREGEDSIDILTSSSETTRLPEGDFSAVAEDSCRDLLQELILDENVDGMTTLSTRITKIQTILEEKEEHHLHLGILVKDVDVSKRSAFLCCGQGEDFAGTSSELASSLLREDFDGARLEGLLASWPSCWDSTGIRSSGSRLAARGHSAVEQHRAPSSFGWEWHISRHRMLSTASLLRPIFLPKRSYFRRKWIKRRVLRTAATASAAAPESASEGALIEEDVEYPSITSIPAGAPVTDVTDNRTSRSPNSWSGMIRQDNSRSSSSVVKASNRRSPNHEQTEIETDEEAKVEIVGGDQGSGKRNEDHSEKILLEAVADEQQASRERGRRESKTGLWIRKAHTVVPRKQPKISESLLQSMQSAGVGLGAGINAVRQALGRTTTSRGVANIMGKFASSLTIQDLKQLLTELGTGPQQNWGKAVEVFDWMHDMAVYDIDAAMYHSMIVLLGKSRKMDVAEDMIERMKMDGLEPDNYVYTALVNGYVRNGDIQKGIGVIDQIKAGGLQPPVPAYNVLIDGCVKVPNGLDLARSLMKQMRQDGISPDRVTYTTMIIVYSRKGHHSEAIRMFKEMQQQNCYPDVLTCNAVLNAYSKLGDVPGMLQVYRSMVEQHVELDTVTFNILLNALGRAGSIKEVSRFYQLMRKMGVTPDVTTCSILVNAYGKARAWDELDLLIAEMEHLGLQPDLAVYNSLISIYGKAGRFEQVELIAKALQSSNGIMFDVITYNTLIDVYGKVGRLSDVIKWFSQMRKQEVKPDVRTFNALVHAYGRASQYEGLKDVLNLFRADGSKPDLVFYHTLLFMFAKGAKYDDAWSVIGDMQSEGYTLTLDIYNSLILVFGRGSAEEAVKIYSHMITSSVKPNSTTFRVLIEVHARKGLVDQCLKIYKKSREFLRDDLNDALLSSVLGACCNMRRMKQAEAVLLMHENQPHLPSVSCFNWLVLGYGRQGMWKEAEQVLERMDSKGLVPNGQSYTFLLEAYSLCGLHDNAQKLKEKMEEHGFLNSVSAFNSLLRLHIRSGSVDLALQLIEDLQSASVKLNHNTYSALISGYGAPDGSVNGRILEYAKDASTLPPEQRHGIYTALLSAMPKCKTYREAYSCLEILQRLDCPNEICSILKGDLGDDQQQQQEEAVWIKLANKFRNIDMNGFNSETQRSLHNALVDALWWLGWEIRALRVVRMGLDLGVFGQVFKWSKDEWTLNLSGGSVGSVQVLLLMWITCLRKMIADGEKIPSSIRIILAEEWQLLLEDNKDAIEAVEAHLKDLGGVYSRSKDRATLRMTRQEVSLWLQQDGLDEKLAFVDSLSQA